MLAQKQFAAAHEQLQALLPHAPDPIEVHLLLAQLHLTADGELRNSEQALTHSRQAVALSGERHPEALRLFAEALGESGQPEEGVRRLEQRYALLPNEKERKTAAIAMEQYRNKFKLGQHWEFFDAQGKAFYQSTSVAKIRERLLTGQLSRTATCRKNHIGEPLPLAEVLVEGPLAMLFNPLRYHFRTGGVIGGMVLAVIALIGVVISFLGQIGMLIGSKAGSSNFAFLAGGVMGSLVGLVLLGSLAVAMAFALGYAIGGLLGGLVGFLRLPWLPKLPCP